MLQFYFIITHLIPVSFYHRTSGQSVPSFCLQASPENLSASERTTSRPTQPHTLHHNGAGSFIHSMISWPTSSGNKWLSHSRAWWESGSSSQRHKHRKTTQNHTTLFLFSSIFSPVSISSSGINALLPLASLVSSFNFLFLMEKFTFSSLQLSVPLIPH